MFVRAACEGGLLDAMALVLCAASLIPLNKKDGGIRPIVVGETLRRLFGKTLLTTPALKEAVQELVPRQTGVGVAKCGSCRAACLGSKGGRAGCGITSANYIPLALLPLPRAVPPPWRGY